MLTLVQFGPCWGVPSPSPFCLKVETYLRIAAIEYRVESQDNPRKAPKGKLPYIREGDITIADSEMILEHLDKKYNLSTDEWLTEKDRAIGVAVKRLCEDHLYWSLLYSRWCDKNNWPIVKKEFFGGFSPLIRFAVCWMARKSAFRTLHTQGFGRHTEEEIYAKGQQDIDVLAVILGENNYILGHQASSYDAIVYGFLANVLYPPFQTSLSSTLKKHANLIAYCERIKSAYFAEIQ